MGTWPTAAEVRDTLKGAGYTAPLLDSVLTDAIDDAVARWEAATGWLPFVGGASTIARDFILDEGQRILQLDAGLRYSTAPELLLDGVALASTTTARWLPTNASLAGKPYTALQLLESGRPSRMPEATLTITGLWGYCASDAVPTAARAAVLAGACWEIASRQTAWRASEATATDGETDDTSGDTIRAAVQQTKEGDVDVQFATTQTERMAALEMWETLWRRGVNTYRRVRIT